MELKKLCLKNNLEIYRFQDSFAKDIERIASIVIVIVNVRKGDCELLKCKRKWFRLSIPLKNNFTSKIATHHSFSKEPG